MDAFFSACGLLCKFQELWAHLVGGHQAHDQDISSFFFHNSVYCQNEAVALLSELHVPPGIQGLEGECRD